MKSLDDNSITLCFTSPPYFNAINYDEHLEKQDGSIDEWERKDMSYSKYKQFLKRRLGLLYEKIESRGHAIINVAPVHWNGKRIPIPFHLVSWMEDIGWQFKEDIIWEKPVAKDRRSGVLLQHPYPGYYYPSVVSEYILVFEKRQDCDLYDDRDEDEKDQNQIDTSDYQGEESKNVWKIRPVSPSEIDHPAPFPQKLARRVIKYYSYREDTVLDMFVGSGQCAIAAKQLDRQYIGFDTKEEYVKTAHKRISEAKNGFFLSKIHDI
jgi:site-specific DNA-methyltransferase (adenine-specific)